MGKALPKEMPSSSEPWQAAGLFLMHQERNESLLAGELLHVNAGHKISERLSLFRLARSHPA